MGDIVSLKQRRKRLARSANEKRAAENRVEFGRSKAERTLTEAARAKAARDLDGHRR